MNICSICSRGIDEETAAVLEMGAYGNPKYLCDECSSDLECATTSTDPQEIAASVDRIAKKVSDGGIKGRTFITVNSILESAAERAKAIKEGNYDFSDDEDESDSFDEIPEELLETEEDRELDRQDEENAEKFNKFFDYVTFGVFIGIAVFVVWKLVDTFLL